MGRMKAYPKYISMTKVVPTRTIIRYTRVHIKDPEKVTNKMYGCNTDISSHFFRIFNLHPSMCFWKCSQEKNGWAKRGWHCTRLPPPPCPQSRLAAKQRQKGEGKVSHCGLAVTAQAQL